MWTECRVDHMTLPVKSFCIFCVSGRRQMIQVQFGGGPSRASCEKLTWGVMSGLRSAYRKKAWKGGAGVKLSVTETWSGGWNMMGKPVKEDGTGKTWPLGALWPCKGCKLYVLLDVAGCFIYDRWVLIQLQKIVCCVAEEEGKCGGWRMC